MLLWRPGAARATDSCHRAWPGTILRSSKHRCTTPRRRTHSWIISAIPHGREGFRQAPDGKPLMLYGRCARAACLPEMANADPQEHETRRRACRFSRDTLPGCDQGTRAGKFEMYFRRLSAGRPTVMASFSSSTAAARRIKLGAVQAGALRRDRERRPICTGRPGAPGQPPARTWRDLSEAYVQCSRRYSGSRTISSQPWLKVQRRRSVRRTGNTWTSIARSRRTDPPATPRTCRAEPRAWWRCVPALYCRSLGDRGRRVSLGSRLGRPSRLHRRTFRGLCRRARCCNRLGGAFLGGIRRGNVLHRTGRTLHRLACLATDRLARFFRKNASASSRVNESTCPCRAASH